MQSQPLKPCSRTQEEIEKYVAHNKVTGHSAKQHVQSQHGEDAYLERCKLYYAGSYITAQGKKVAVVDEPEEAFGTSQSFS